MKRFSCTVPGEGRVLLSVLGEEEASPVDLTGVLEELLLLGATSGLEPLLAGEGVEFANIDFPDGTEFRDEGAPMTLERAGDLLGLGLRVSLAALLARPA